MTKRKRSTRDPENEERRRIVKGGLLAAAAALGFLPGCSDENQSAHAVAGGAGTSGDGATSGASGTTAATAGGGTPSSGGSSATASGGGGAKAASGGGGNNAGSTAASAGRSGSPSAMADAAAGSAGTQPSAMPLPRATLGKTGVSIPILGLGTSRLGERGGTPNAADYSKMLTVFNAAIDMGIEYLDTGANYGRAEEALGEVTQGRRDKVFLVTKLYTDTRSEAKSLFERSLQRLKTDHVDVLHLHSAGERNIDTVLSASGSWPYILEQKAMGKTRFVGITGHSNPPNFTRMLATGQVDVLMTIMNFVDHSTYGFSKTVREDALARGVGVMAMKVFGGTESILQPGRGLANTAAPEPHPSNVELSFDVSVLPDCMRFVKGLGGVTGMVIGINFVEELQRNIEWAIATQPFSPAEMDAIIKMGQTVAPMWAQRYG